MKIYQVTTSFIEVPGELSVVISFTGCPIRCKDCHSKHLWDRNSGQIFSKFDFIEILNKYSGLASCITFFGGEWHTSNFLELLKLATQHNYKTCLYTGLSDIPNSYKEFLTYLKTGPYIKSLGGLESKQTNQKLVNLKTNTDITNQFQRTI